MKKIDTLIEYSKYDADILAVMLFGSSARDENSKDSDIDICLILKPANYTALFLSQKKLQYLKEFSNLDVQIYQQLPLYIRQRILKDGKILFCNDEDALYNVAFKTIQEYEDYKHIYTDYLKEVGSDR